MCIDSICNYGGTINKFILQLINHMQSLKLAKRKQKMDPKLLPNQLQINMSRIILSHQHSLKFGNMWRKVYWKCQHRILRKQFDSIVITYTNAIKRSKLHGGTNPQPDLSQNIKKECINRISIRPYLHQLKTNR